MSPHDRSLTQWTAAALCFVVGTSALLASCSQDNGALTPSPALVTGVSSPVRPSLWVIEPGGMPVRLDVNLPVDILGMAAGRGGVWILGSRAVMNLQPAQGTTRVIPLPGPASVIAIDRLLGVWIGGGSKGGGALWNIDPNTKAIVRTVALPTRPEALAIEHRALTPFIWGISARTGTMFQVDAQTGQLVGYNFIGRTLDIAADSSGAWVAWPDSTIAQVASLMLRSPLYHQGGLAGFTLPGADVVAIALSQRTIWGLDVKGEQVFPVNRSTLKIESPIPVGPHSTDITVDGEYVWVANENFLSRIEEATHAVKTIVLPGLVSSMAVADPLEPLERGVAWVLVTGP